jgi:hypothetical protein
MIFLENIKYIHLPSPVFDLLAVSVALAYTDNGLYLKRANAAPAESSSQAQQQPMAGKRMRVRFRSRILRRIG